MPNPLAPTIILSHHRLRIPILRANKKDRTPPVLGPEAFLTRPDLSLEAWKKFAKDIEEGSPKPVINTLKKMAEEIPEVARKIADQMLQKYGRNDIYYKIVQQITDRAEITLRHIKE